MTEPNPDILNPNISSPVNQTSYKKQFALSSIIAVVFMAISVSLLYQNLNLAQTLLSRLSSQNTIPPTPTSLPSPSSAPTIAQPLTPTPGFTHTRIGECTKDQCLFSGREAPEGFAYLTGYYTTYSAIDWESPTTCNGFVVTGGNQILIDHFNDWINKGNGLNKIIDGNLVINITLDEKYKNLIKSSNLNNQIALGVLRKSPQGRSGSTCTPVVDIVSLTAGTN